MEAPNPLKILIFANGDANDGPMVRRDETRRGIVLVSRGRSRGGT